MNGNNKTTKMYQIGAIILGVITSENIGQFVQKGEDDKYSENIQNTNKFIIVIGLNDTVYIMVFSKIFAKFSFGSVYFVEHSHDKGCCIERKLQ